MESRVSLIDADSIIYYALSSKKEEPIKTIEEAKNYIDKFINGIMSYTHSTHYIMTLTIGRNFRYDIDVNYKSDRKAKPKHPDFNIIRQYLIDEYGAIYDNYLESDDMVHILSKKIPNSFIAACDSDILEGLPGRHFNYKIFKWVEATKEQAHYKFFSDLIIGTHNGIKGLHMKGKSFVEKRFNSNISPGGVLDCYVEHYNSSDIGIKEFWKNYQLLRLKDEWDIFELPMPIKYMKIKDVEEVENKDKKEEDLWN